MPTDPTYTTLDAVRDYLGKTTEELPDDTLLRPVLMAQRDLTTAMGPNLYRNPDLGSQLNLSRLLPFQVEALKEAMGAQVEYRAVMGDDFFVKEQHAAQSGPDYSTTGTVRKVCGAAYAALHRGGLLNLHGRAGVSRTAGIYPNPLDRRYLWNLLPWDGIPRP